MKIVAVVVLAWLAAVPALVSAEEAVVRELKETLLSLDDLSKWPAEKPDIDKMLEASEGQPKVRWELAAALATHAWSLEIGNQKRKQLVSKIVALMSDADALVASSARTWLLKFQAVDFAEDARQMVIMNCRGTPSRGAIKLMGALDMDRRQYDQIEAWAREPLTGDRSGRYGNRTWWSQLAMARIGDMISLKSVIKEVDQEKDLMLKIELLKDLKYVRRPEVIPSLIKVLNSDERLPPQHKGGDGPLCAIWAAEVLCELVQGAPLPGKTGLNDDYVKTFREWAAGQSEWKFRQPGSWQE